MKFHPTSLEGVWLIELDPREDERGHLVRTYCQQEFAARGLNTWWVQCNSTRTRRRGMVRGMHFQAEPKPEIKLIRCTRGEVLDVLVDVRPGSKTFGRWEGFPLGGDRVHWELYVPAGMAHGFQCLTDDCEMFYQMSEFYVPALARGVRWNDPAVGIRWPVATAHVSERDAKLPLLSELTAG